MHSRLDLWIVLELLAFAAARALRIAMSTILPQLTQAAARAFFAIVEQRVANRGEHSIA
jgi:hypothetical protein